MVPTLTCGLSRSNFSFATFRSLLYRLVCPPPWANRGNLSECWIRCVLPAGASSRCVRSGPRSHLGGYRLSRPLLDDLLGNARRDLLVGVDLHRVRSAALRVGAQISRVSEHLAERHPRRDGERVAARLLALDASAATREVADHRAEELLGGDDLDREDRLQQNRVGAPGRLLEGDRARDLERDLRGVHVVV